MTHVMSDIHGNLDRYRSVMSKINLAEEDHLYVLGDVIDRYPFGIEILLELMEMKNATVLLGNHELMMIKAIQGSIQYNPMEVWNRNGGRFTRMEFLNQPEKTQKRILDYLTSLPLTAEVEAGGKQYLLVHGAPPELHGKIPAKYMDKKEFSVWTRLGEDDLMPEGKTVIFGHTPTEYYQEGVPLRIWHGGDKIGIDCGAGHGHPVCRLACIRLDDMVEYYSD